MSKLFKAVPLLGILALGACGDTTSSTSSLPLAASPATGSATGSASASQPALPAVVVPEAIALRSAALATNGKSFDQAFYNTSASTHAQNIAELTQAFVDLGPEVDPQEARRAATVVYTYVDQLVVQYEIEDRPLVHNTKVNFGTKPRGLCWHWAHDLDARLQKERFQTLEIHRAIANYDNIRLEHSTTILGRKGDPMSEAIVLDPWRKGGDLFWRKVKDDSRYRWTPRDEVFAWKRARDAKKAE